MRGLTRLPKDEPDQLGATFHAGPLVDRREVDLDRTLGNPERRGDHPVCAAVEGEGEDVALAIGEVPEVDEGAERIPTGPDCARTNDGKSSRSTPTGADFPLGGVPLQEHARRNDFTEARAIGGEARGSGGVGIVDMTVAVAKEDFPRHEIEQAPRNRLQAIGPTERRFETKSGTNVRNQTLKRANGRRRMGVIDDAEEAEGPISVVARGDAYRASEAEGAQRVVHENSGGRATGIPVFARRILVRFV